VNNARNSLVIRGLTVYAEHGTLDGAGMIVERGVIREILPDIRKKDLPDIETIHFPDTYNLIPGMIDMHIHGAAGADVMDASSEALQTISNSLPAEGTTAFLATTMTETPRRIEEALRSVREYVDLPRKMAGAEVLGVHMEGPFLSPERKGAQRGDMIIPPDRDLFGRWQDLSGDLIKLVTVAPERTNDQEFVRYLKQHGVIASVGHSVATYEETLAAIEAGCSHATHLYNAMAAIHHRAPGTVVAVLLDDRVTAELIVDGVHLHPAMIKLAFEIKGKEKLVLVTDAMRAKYLGDGSVELGGQQVTVKAGEARLANGTLAGSVLKMNGAVKNIISFTACSLEDAVKMTSENPARELAIFDRKGSIAEGKDADLVVLDENYQAVLTLCRGRIAYRSDTNFYK